MCLWMVACGAPEPSRPPQPAPAPEARRIPTCSPATGTATFLVRDARDCWYQSPHGRWRLVSHDLHYDVLVVRTVAEHLDAAGDVGRRFAELHGERFREISIYVEQEADATPALIRRVVWTRAGGFSVLDFPAD
jgi:hypothetical protein